MRTKHWKLEKPFFPVQPRMRMQRVGFHFGQWQTLRQSPKPTVNPFFGKISPTTSWGQQLGYVYWVTENREKPLHLGNILWFSFATLRHEKAVPPWIISFWENIVVELHGNGFCCFRTQGFLTRSGNSSRSFFLHGLRLLFHCQASVRHFPKNRTRNRNENSNVDESLEVITKQKKKGIIAIVPSSLVLGFSIPIWTFLGWYLTQVSVFETGT